MGWYRESRRHSLASRGIKSAQRTRCITATMKNLDMNPKTYQLRRKVIDLLYEARREGIDLPRIDVRITEEDCENPRVMGRGGMGAKIIWIPKSTINLPENELRYTVLHEIGHSVYNLKHSKEGLMRPIHKHGLTKKEIYDEFKDAIKNKGESQ